MTENLTAVFIVVALSACTVDSNKAETILKNQGYKDISLTGYKFGCGRGESSTGFTAFSSFTGQVVEGMVCCGIGFKGCTVRVD